AAKYSFDINRPGMLWAKLVWSPHAHAELVSVDTAAAEKLPGVKATWRSDPKEIQFAGQIVAAVAPETEEIATEAACLGKAEYKVLEPQVRDTDAAHADEKAGKREQGNVDEGFQKADIVVNGNYGAAVIAHCCLESHGQVTEIGGDELNVWAST